LSEGLDGKVFMARWAAVIVVGIFSAVGAGFFFWFVNGMHRVGGVGLLRRQEWPVNSLWFWVVLGGMFGALAKLVGDARRVSHARNARALAEELGRPYSEEYSLPVEAQSLPVFAGWSDGRHALTGHVDDAPITLFDFTTVMKGNDSDTVTNGTAVLLPTEGLPAFDLRPRTFGRRLLGWAGFEGLTFDPATAEPFDVETVQRFSQSFHLAAVDPLSLLGALAENGPTGSVEEEATLRQFFTPSIMSAVNPYPEYSLQSRPGFLVVWRGSGVLPVRKRTELWNAAVDLRRLLTRPPKIGAAPVVAARADTDVRVQGRKLRNTMIGGVVGLFVGFILSSMVLSIMFFGPAKNGPGQGFFVQPVLFFGITLCGAVVGAGMASRVRVRSESSGQTEDPARRARRQRWIGGGVVVGLFAGFFGGFVAFVASKILFDFNMDNFGLEGALFFGSIFGGALLGAVLGGLTANRLFRWRS
jgi:hypothetical protein